MIEDKDAQELTEKFVAGAPCSVNAEKTLRMYWSHYVDIATNRGHKTITIDDVKEYWFKRHNALVLLKLAKKLFTTEEAQNCMVSSKEKEGHLFCFHGGLPVCSISEQEKLLLDEQAKKLIGGSQ